MTQKDFAQYIATALETNTPVLQQQWRSSTPVKHFYIDDLLPAELAKQIFAALPDAATLMLRDTEKERKRVGIALENYHPLMKAILFAFQEQNVIDAVKNITSMPGLTPDESLYGSGISMMLHGDYLMPHLDNSHDGDGELYRVINTLYYISPDWPADKGGNLELWDKDMKEHVELHSKFNRLIVMGTNTQSIHSVNKIEHTGTRACISNYYFSKTPADTKQYIHKTTFYARPEDGIVKRFKFQAEGVAKNFLSGIFSNKATGTKHRRK